MKVIAGGSERVTKMVDGEGSEIRDKIRAYLQENFPAAATGNISDDTSLLEEGIVDSMGILSIVTFIEDGFGISVTDDDLVGENFESISALHAFISRES